MKIDPVIFEGKKVGTIVGRHVYISHRNMDKHLFRGGAPDVKTAISKNSAAWGVSYDLLQFLKTLGVKVVCVADSKTRKNYWVSISRLERSKDFKELGHGLQLFLGLSDWCVEKDLAKLVEACEEALKGERK